LAVIFHDNDRFAFTQMMFCKQRIGLRQASTPQRPRDAADTAPEDCASKCGSEYSRSKHGPKSWNCEQYQARNRSQLGAEEPTEFKALLHIICRCAVFGRSPHKKVDTLRSDTCIQERTNRFFCFEPALKNEDGVASARVASPVDRLCSLHCSSSLGRQAHRLSCQSGRLGALLSDYD